MLKIGNKMRFILAVVAGELRISNRRKADVVADLERSGFDRLPPARKACCCVLVFGPCILSTCMCRKLNFCKLLSSSGLQSQLAAKLASLWKPCEKRCLETQ